MATVTCNGSAVCDLHECSQVPSGEGGSQGTLNQFSVFIGNKPLGSTGHIVDGSFKGGPLKRDHILKGHFLIGFHGAAIESAVTDDKAAIEGPVVLQAFVEKDLASIAEAELLAAQISQYGGELAQIFSRASPTVSVEILEYQDWSETWKVHFKPFAIVPGLVIAPTWEQYEAGMDEQVIVMDPGMAFGTGTHATTAMCLEWLDSLDLRGKTLLDFGCGYGRICEIMDGLGYRKIIGLDIAAKMITRGRKRNPHLDLRVLNPGQWPGRPECFDAVVLFAVLTCICSPLPPPFIPDISCLLWSILPMSCLL